MFSRFLLQYGTNKTCLYLWLYLLWHLRACGGIGVEEMHTFSQCCIKILQYFYTASDEGSDISASNRHFSIL